MVGIMMLLYSEKMMHSTRCIPVWFHVEFTQNILNGIYQPAALSAMRKLSAETSTGINHGLLSYIDADSDQSNGLLERERAHHL